MVNNLMMMKPRADTCLFPRVFSNTLLFQQNSQIVFSINTPLLKEARSQRKAAEGQLLRPAEVPQGNFLSQEN